MAAQERIEYHWIENRIVETPVERPQHTDKWRFNNRSPTLIATIEESDSSFYLREGRASSPERVVDCVRMYKKVMVDDSIHDSSGGIPQSVREELRTKLNEVIASVQPQWDSFGEETDITGLLKGRLNEIIVDRDGWRIAVKTWTYRRYPKENIIGADLGVIFDVVNGNKRIIKAMWYQAKKARNEPSSLDDVKDLAEQVEKMKGFTKEAYTLIYTPEKVVATRGMNTKEFQPLADNLVDGAVCVRGDRNPTVVANTVDIKNVIRFFISGPETTKTLPARRA